jgi:hypothetical protein
MAKQKVVSLLVSFTLLAGCYKGSSLKGDADEDGTGDPVADDGSETVEGCPAAWPEPGSACSVEGASCEYGSETCCGVTHPSYVCQCQAGLFACYYTDACMGAPFGCACEVDEDCEDGFGRAWCMDGVCVPCDDSGSTCDLWCPDGFVPARNGCQPCECAPGPCETVGQGACTCDVLCGEPGTVCEPGLGRCVENVCATIDCASLCDPLRGCVEPECESAGDCKILYSSCGCQAVVFTDPRTELDPCLYDGGVLCDANTCEIDGIAAECMDGLCVEVYPPGCGG